MVTEAFVMCMGARRLRKGCRCTMMGKLGCYELIGNDPFPEAVGIRRFEGSNLIV